MNLEKLYKTTPDRDKLMYLFRFIEDELYDRRLENIDKILIEYDYIKGGRQLTIGMLRGTFRVRLHLKNWELLRDRSRNILSDRELRGLI